MWLNKLKRREDTTVMSRNMLTGLFADSSGATFDR